MKKHICRVAGALMGVLTLVHVTGATSWAAAGAEVPEIDGSLLTAGVGALAAGVLVLRARRNR